MLEIKFKESGTPCGVASGIANYAYYFAAMHKYAPAVTITDNPLNDYWSNLKDLEARFLPSITGPYDRYITGPYDRYDFDETTNPIFRTIMSSGPIEIMPSEYATVKVPFEPTEANLGRMAVWGQIISPTGSYHEKIRRNSKTRIETIAKSAFYIPEGLSEVSGLLPHAFVECARRYNLYSEYEVRETKQESWTW